MNPSLVVLPTGFSIPDRDLPLRLKAMVRKESEEAIKAELKIGSQDWCRVLHGQAVPTPVLYKVLHLLDRFDGQRLHP